MRSLFHVGYRKCGSTFLQQRVFRQHPLIAYQGKGGLSRYIVYTPFGDYDRGYAAREFEKRRLAEEAGKSILVLSDEGITSRAGIDPGLIADRLSQLDRTGQILIVIRNQFDLFASEHAHCLATGKTQIPSLFQWIEEMRRSGSANSLLQKADFAAQIHAFDKIIGAERIGVFLLEDLRTDPQAFARELGDFLMLDLGGLELAERRAGSRKADPRMPRASRWSILVNTSKTMRMIDRVTRPLAPPLAKRTLRWVTGLDAPFNSAITADVRSFLGELYSESNRALAARLGRELIALGYPN